VEECPRACDVGLGRRRQHRGGDRSYSPKRTGEQQDTWFSRTSVLGDPTGHLGEHLTQVVS
jgi:hypothetical protein